MVVDIESVKTKRQGCRANLKTVKTLGAYTKDHKMKNKKSEMTQKVRLPLPTQDTRQNKIGMGLGR